MNLLTTIFFITLLITSCGQSNSEDLNTNLHPGFEINQPEIESDTLFQEDFIPPEEISDQYYIFLEDFPAIWISLTDNSDISDEKYADGYSIFKPCFFETPQLSFRSGKGDDWFLTILSGQDLTEYLVEEFKAEQTEQELYQVVNGSFELVSLDQSTIKTISFWWNRDISFACFEGVFEEPMYYVPEINQDEYEKASELCPDEL